MKHQSIRDYQPQSEDVMTLLIKWNDEFLLSQWHCLEDIVLAVQGHLDEIKEMNGFI